MICNFFRYLLRGSDVQYLDRSWLANKERLAMYEQWTLNERESAYVSKGVDHFRRENFWRAVEAKQQQQSDVGERLLRWRSRRSRA